MIIIISDNSPTELEKAAIEMMETAIVVNQNSSNNSMGSQITVVKSADINQIQENNTPEELFYCPMTLNIPEDLEFWGKNIFKTCREVEHLRTKVTMELGVNVGDGELWLPIMLTDKGPIYGEVIGVSSQGNYEQPIDFTDDVRQVIYNFGYQLLKILNAPSATYLLQYNWQAEKLIFDRLFPFPHLSAIASNNVQQPNLFTCHWQCLTHQPIYEVYLPSSSQPLS